jgi:hypothetical protein
MRRHFDRQMLWKRLKSWLGWDAGSGLLGFGDLEPRPPQPPIAVKTRPKPEPPAAAAPRPKTVRRPLDVLDNPRLTLDKPGDDGFDPYNTGAFNRSASWEKIGRQRKR